MEAQILIFLTTIVLMVSALEDRNRASRFGSDPSGSYDPSLYGGGIYYHDDSGRYIPDYSGLYRHDGTGNYAHDNSGDYMPEKYERFRYKKPSFTTRRPKLSEPLEDASEEESHHDLSVVGFYKHEIPKVIKRKIPRYDGHWKIIKQAGGVGKTGYNYLYETENKILAQEKAKVTNKGTKDESIESKGYYQYVGDDDMQYKLTYTADENGFIPQGDHLPKSIVRLLEYHKAHG